MTPFKFYFWFTIFVEFFTVFPIFFGLKKWGKLSYGMRFFLGFLIADLCLNLIADYYYYIIHNNLFLWYFYSFFENACILLAYVFFFEKKRDKIWVLLLLILNSGLLVLDFMFVSKMGYNYLSGACINCIICAVSVYYFSTTFIHIDHEKNVFNEINLTVSLILILQFFVKFIDAFLEKYLLETINNVVLWLQVKDIYAYFMLFCLVLYTYVFYKGLGIK